ncbi:MAG TPA: polymer-forming cytoskeletal protein [Aggregatilineales bacterium]|nr:polymer-forming cytoskeletal protein [Aggregatilineales bacterium]
MFGARKTQSTPVSATSSSSSITGGSGQGTPKESRESRESRTPVGYETVVGAHTTLKGEFKAQANVRIDGSFEGGLDIEGNVLIGETAHIMADIQGRNISIAGAVRGNVSGTKVQLMRTGRVWGDISASSLSTEDGAYIDGKVTMVGHPAGLAGFEPAGSLPAPEVSLLHPIAEDAESGEPVEAEFIDDEKVPRKDDKDRDKNK